MILGYFNYGIKGPPLGVIRKWHFSPCILAVETYLREQPCRVTCDGGLP